MRPIDADALLENLDEACGDLDLQYNSEYEKLVHYIESQPVLDFAPVMNAEWIDEIEPNAVTASGREVHVFRCSACDFTWANKTAVLHYFKHCPNCGSRMDGEK